MATFHSTVSRRDFMKGLGLAGGGIGASALTAPAFHDLDELTSSHLAEDKRAWYVKKLEHEHPTVELDWSVLQRYDQRNTTQTQHWLIAYGGRPAYDKMVADAAAFKDQVNGSEGSTVRDQALSAATGWAWRSSSSTAASDYKFAGPQVCKTPAQLNLSPVSGTPEENARTLRAAAKFLGLTRIGITELGPASSDARKLVYTYIRAGSTKAAYTDAWPPTLQDCRQIKMEDVDIGSDDGQIWHLPNKPLWKISCMVPMSKDAWRTAMPDKPSGVSSSANGARYVLYCNIKYRLQEFLRGIGYMGYGGVWSGEQIVPSESSAVLGGIAEMGRHSEAAIDPEYGANNGYWTMVTDLPLAPDPPVDAGIFRFCHTCRKCANACPSNSISQDSEPTFDVPGFDWKVPNVSNNPGKKLFWTNMYSCAMYQKVHGCSICRPVCTFNDNTGAMAHDLVKATIATTSLFNSTFWQLSKPFGYGLKDAESWWDMSLPANGIDSTLLSANGGYR